MTETTKYYDCYFLNSGLHFNPDEMRFCCAPKVIGPKVCFENFDYDIILKELFEKRNTVISQMKKHIIPEECQSCIYLTENDQPNDSENTESTNFPKISSIIINHFKQCDCRCCYCTTIGYHGEFVTEPIKSKYYDLLPILETLYEQDLIDKNSLNVEFQGGSIGVLEEFPDVVNIFLKNNVKSISFFSNGIKYSKAIQEASEKAKCLLITSVDAGTAETFKKLKKVDKFNQVITNLKRYKEEAPYLVITAKYILIDGINDNEEELDKFLNAVADAKVNNVQMDLDFRKVMFNDGKKYVVPQKYKDLYKFFDKRAKELGVCPYVWGYVQNILDKGYSE